MIKGIVLAGGTGSRLFPLTQVFSKQLLPIYDKPMIYYPLCALMQANIRDILIITTPHDQPLFTKLLRDGSQWGISISYAVQESPKGIAESFIIGKRFIDNGNVCLILGDNIFHGQGIDAALKRAASRVEGATVFGYWVKDSRPYGVIEFDKEGGVVGIEEKPQIPKSNYAVTGLYFYDNQVSDVAANLKPSGRGELEITDINKHYLKQGKLSMEKLGRGTAWLDTGTHESLMQASNFIETIESRQGLKVACPEEISYFTGWIDRNQLEKLAGDYSKNSYGEYLLGLVSHDRVE